MACRGIHFALTSDDACRLLAVAGDDDAVISFLQEIEGRWDEDWLCETDKAWDAMHRCLSGGSLGSDGSTLSKCVLGGRSLHAGGDYIVSYLDESEVRVVSADLSAINEQWMRSKYTAIPDHGYEGPTGDEDFDYTWEYFQDLQEFLRKAAKASRSVVFLVDQ